MSWVPSTDFEDEIVSFQPDHNFIYGALCDDDDVTRLHAEPHDSPCYPRPKAHVDFVRKQRLERLQHKADAEQSGGNGKVGLLKTMEYIQRIAATKPLGQLPTIEDWDNPDTLERETTAILHHYGLGPSTETLFNQQCTIATLPVTREISYGRKGGMPLFLDEKFFKMEYTDEDEKRFALSSTEEGTSREDSSNPSGEIMPIPSKWSSETYGSSSIESELSSLSLTTTSSLGCSEAAIKEHGAGSAKVTLNPTTAKPLNSATPDRNSAAAAAAAPMVLTKKRSSGHTRPNQRQRFYSPKELYCMKRY